MPTTLEPFEISSLRNPNECLLENVVCRWVEVLNETYLSTHDVGDEESDNSNAGVPSTAARSVCVSSDGGSAFMLIDFGVLHAAAMFDEPSMLAEHFEGILEETHGLKAAFGSKSLHTLWILTGLADFWNGTEGDGDHYSAALIRVFNRSTSNRFASDRHTRQESDVFIAMGSEGLTMNPSQTSSVDSSSPNGAEMATTVSHSDPGVTPSPIATPTTFVPSPPPITAAAASAQPVMEAFVFDSSGDKNVGLTARLARFVSNAMATSTSLGGWLKEAIYADSNAASVTDVGSVPIWAWRRSPRQMSPVGCGVFMSAHLEALVRLWRNGLNLEKVQRGADRGVVETLGLACFTSAIIAQQKTPNIVVRLGECAAPAQPNNVFSTRQLLSPPAADMAEVSYLLDWYCGPHGDGTKFEGNFRRHMATLMGI